MGPDKFYLVVRNSGMSITLDECVQLREQWFDMWIEMKRYIDDLIVDKVVPEDFFENHKGGEDELDEEDVMYEPLAAMEKKNITLYKAANLAGIWRVGAGKQMALNFPFQSLAAVISKRALWLVYLDSISCGWYKLVNFIHNPAVSSVKKVNCWKPYSQS